MRFILFILLFHFNGYSQLVRKIVDRETQLPIPYVTVKVLHSNKGVVASEDGSFHLEIFDTDSVMFSCVGYEQQILRGKDIGNIISLFPKSKLLNEVAITKLHFIRTLVFGNKNAIDKAVINWGPSGNKEEFAQKIELPDSTLWYQIKKVYVPVKKVQCWGQVLLHLYLTDRNDYPGEEIFMKPIAVTSSNIDRGKLIIDLTNEKIYVSNSKIFFVSIGWASRSIEKKCKTIILLNRSAEINTYSRSLASETYYWHPILFGSDEWLPLNTLYSVELDELK